MFKGKLGSSLNHQKANAALIRLENNNPRVGLVNLGNTCYMNSVLQALVMTKHFSRELLLSYPRSCSSVVTAALGNSSSHGGLKSELVFTIQKLLAQLLHSRRPELTPREVLHVTRPPSFLPGHQQDSSEFLSHLMDTLHEHEMSVHSKHPQQPPSGTKMKAVISTTMSTVAGGQQLQQTPQRRKRPATETCTREDNDDEEEEEENDVNTRQKMHQEQQQQQLMDEEDEEEENYDQLNNTLIQRSFGGLLETTYHCLSCGQRSTNRDVFREVSLSFGLVRSIGQNKTRDDFNMFVTLSGPGL